MLTHALRRHVAWINGGITGGKQRDKARLRSFQMKCHRVAVGADRFEVAVPRLAWIGAQFFRPLSEYQVPRAFYIGSGERLAVVPAYVTPQAEREFRGISVPRPFRRQIGNDRIQSVLRNVLFVYNEIIEH